MDGRCCSHWVGLQASADCLVRVPQTSAVVVGQLKGDAGGRHIMILKQSITSWWAEMTRLRQEILPQLLFCQATYWISLEFSTCRTPPSERRFSVALTSFPCGIPFLGLLLLPPSVPPLRPLLPTPSLSCYFFAPHHPRAPLPPFHREFLCALILNEDHEARMNWINSFLFIFRPDH